MRRWVLTPAVNHHHAVVYCLDLALALGFRDLRSERLGRDDCSVIVVSLRISHCPARALGGGQGGFCFLERNGVLPL